jgi:hypothetical protein
LLILTTVFGILFEFVSFFSLKGGGMFVYSKKQKMNMFINDVFKKHIYFFKNNINKKF